MSGGRTFKVIFDGELSPAFQASVAAAGGKIEEVGKKTTSTGDQIVKAMQVGSVAVSGIGVAIEALARKQQDMNVQVGQTAAAIGISASAFRDMATSIASAGLPLSDVVPLLKLANQEGLQGEAALKAYANFWDDVGDATGKSSVELAKMSTGLRAVGVSAGNESQALASFGFITDHTKIGVDDFLSLLQKKGAHLHEFGISIDDTAAILGVMEHSLGLTGKAAATELASGIDKSDGSLTDLLRTLGITTDQFDAMRKQVDQSSGVIERNARIQDDTITTMERWKEKIDEFLFSHADMVKQLSDFAPLIIGVGPAVNIAIKAYEGSAAAITWLTTVTGLHAAAATADAGAIAAEGTAAAAATPEIAALATAESAAAAAGGVELAGGFLLAAGAAAPLVVAAAGLVEILGAVAVSAHDSGTEIRAGVLVYSDSGQMAESTASAWRRAAIAAGENKDAVMGMSAAEIQWHIDSGQTLESLVALNHGMIDQKGAIIATTPAVDTFIGRIVTAAGHETRLAAVTADVINQLHGLPSAAHGASVGIWDLVGAAGAAVGQMLNLQQAIANVGAIQPWQRSTGSRAISSVASAIGSVAGRFSAASAIFQPSSGGGGSGGGASAAAEEIVQSFGDSVAQALQGLDLEKEFGSTGERLVETFYEAIADPKKSAALGPAIASLIKEAEAAGVPNAKQLGADLINAIGDGLQTGNGDAVYTAMHALADALGEAGVASRKALSDIAKDQEDLASAFAATEKGITTATDKEKADLASLASSHQEALQKIQASIEQAKADYAEAAAARRADYAEAKAQRAADAADALATRHQDAADARDQRHQDSLDKLAEMADDHKTKIEDINEQLANGVSESEYKSLVKQRDAEEKRYKQQVDAENKRIAKADADAAKALAKQDEQAAKALAKQEAAAAKAQAKADEAAATAERKKEAALTLSIDAENKKFADQQVVVLKRYADELKALQASYAEKELALNKHMAAMAKIAGIGGDMLPVTIDWSIPAPANSPAMRWDSANQRWVDTGHMPLPGYAGGTDYAPGGLAIVGERGPELVNLPRGSQVFPNRGGGMGAAPIINIYGDWHASEDTRGRISAGTMDTQLARHLRALGVN